MSTIEVASNAAATTWDDWSGRIRRETLRMGGAARNGEIGQGFGFDLLDPDADVTLPAKRVVRLTIGATVRARGRISSKGVGRAAGRGVGDERAFDVELFDGNAHLYGIVVHDWVRPAETDVARVTALHAAFLDGTPRASTNLATTYLASGSPVNLPAKTYEATDPNGVLAEIGRMAGKLYFVTVDDELFYDDEASVAYASTAFSVTDVTPNGTSSFAPIFGSATQDGAELLSGIRLLYGSTGTTQASVTVSDAGVAAAHDHWEASLFSTGSTTPAEATAEATSLLDEVKLEEESYRFSVLLTEAQLGKIKYGQTFSFRAAAAGVLSAKTIRAQRIEYREAGDGSWFVAIESGWPDRLAPRLEKVAGSIADPNLGQVIDDAICGCEPFVECDPIYGGDFAIFDSFTRVEAANNWGTSDWGLVWTDSGGTVTVNGTQGSLSTTLLGSAGAVIEADVGIPFVVQVDYECSSVHDDVLGFPPESLAIHQGGGAGPALLFYFDIHTGGGNHASRLSVTGLGTGGSIEEDGISLAGSTGTITVSATLTELTLITPLETFTIPWNDGPGNPVTLASNEDFPYLDLSATRGGSLLISEIRIKDRSTYGEHCVEGGPDSGQPVNNETAGTTADGIETTFDTGYAYKAGGLRVKINGVDMTASVSSFDPTGSVTFPQPPRLGAEITFDYVAG